MPTSVLDLRAVLLVSALPLSTSPLERARFHAATFAFQQAEIGSSRFTIALRSADDTDSEFVRTVHHQAYRELVERQFGPWEDLPARLQTLHPNDGAASLYQRLGFQQVGHTSTRLLFEWRRAGAEA